MTSAFIMFSGVAALNCCGTSLAAPESFPSICWALRAVPIRKSFLNVSFSEGIFDVVPAAFFVLEQFTRNKAVSTMEMVTKNFLLMELVFVYDTLFSEGY